METNPEKIVSNFYFEIDTILDTRLPIVYLLNQNIAEEIVAENLYHTRRKNNFKTISNDIFNALYRNRSKRILELALPTPMLSIIRSHYGEVLKVLIKKGVTKTPEMYVNMHPYDLSQTEIDNISFIINKVIPGVIIKFVSMSNAELTPEWIKDNIGCMFKYDGLEWLEYHVGTGNLINTPLLSVHLFTPGIVIGTTPVAKINKETYEAMITACQTVIDIGLMHLSDFSFVKEKNVKT